MWVYQKNIQYIQNREKANIVVKTEGRRVMSKNIYNNTKVKKSKYLHVENYHMQFLQLSYRYRCKDYSCVRFLYRAIRLSNI